MAGLEEDRDLRVVFLVRGMVSPDLLGRAVGLLAQQACVPSEVAMRRAGDALVIRVVLEALGTSRALILAEKMRALVTVYSVRLRQLA